MQKKTAISQVLLLLAFYLAPFAGATQASVPFCCRGNGAHHCARSEQFPVSGTALQTPNRCPYRFPSVLLTHGTQLFFGRTSDSTLQLSAESLLFGTGRSFTIQPSGYSVDSRGPPALSL